MSDTQTPPENTNPTDETSTGLPDQTPSTETAERPAWLPPEFETPEDFAKSYQELQTAKADTENAFESERAALPQNLQKFHAEFVEVGALSPESYQELAEKHGLSKAHVDTFISGIQAKQEAYFKAVYSETKGEEGFQQLSRWAVANVPQAELEAVNEALTSGIPAKAALAVRALVARYEDVEGRAPELIGGATSFDDGDGGAFKSLAEVTAAIGDPRYAKDPAYRKVVEKRLAVSDCI